MATTPSSPAQVVAGTPPPAPQAPSTIVPLASSPTIILPQSIANVSERHFRYTPATGANNSLYITPNITNPEGMVEIKIGILLPYSLPNNVTQTLTFSGTSAIRLAASEINANNLIPGAYVTLVLKDSFNGNDPDNSGAAQAIFSTVSLLQTEGVVGVIGDVSSALSVQSALLTSRLSIPQCSFSAGSTQLSSKEDYGHFFRTIPTELMFGRVMMDFVASRGWQKIAVFYTSDPLGSELMDNIEFQATKRNITVAFRRAFWELGTSSDVGPAVSALKDSGIQIVLVAAVGQPQVRLMMEAIDQGLVSKDYVWMMVKQVTEPLLSMKGNPITPEQLNGLFMFDNLLKLTGYRPFEQFLDKWVKLDPLDYPYAGQRDISSNEAQAYSCMMVMASGMSRAVKSNWTALHMLANGRLGSMLYPADMNTGYVGPGGPMSFDENGDVIYGNFILYNFQHGEMVAIGTSYSGVFNLSSPPMYFDGSYKAPLDSAPLRVLNPTFGSSVGMVIISVSGLFILFSILIMIVVITYRQAQVIKASSPLFCCLELFGFILLYFSTIMSLDIPQQFNCITRPVVLNIGFVLVVSNIVAKNFRVYRIFHNIYVTKRVIHDSHLLKIVGTLMFGNLIIMTIWFARYPPVVQQTAMSNFTSYWTCDYTQGRSMPFFAVVLVYDVILLLVATYLAYMNRNVAANYNECRQISFVVYNIVLSGVLTLPTLFLPKEQFITTFILTNVVVLFGTTFSMGFMFVPKLYKLFTQLERESNSRHESTEESSFDGIIHHAGNNHLSPGGGGGGGGGCGGAGFGPWLGSSSNVNDQSNNNNHHHYQPPVSSSSHEDDSYHWTGGRKGSVTTLDDARGDTLHEAHMGYMGIKVQHRYLPLLSNWRMRRMVLFPHQRYFMSFEQSRPETAHTYPYKSVTIESRAPGKYILRVVGAQWYDFLLQVKDEERLLHWYSLFEMRPASTYYSNAGIPTTYLSTSSLGLLGNLVIRPAEAALPNSSDQREQHRHHELQQQQQRQVGLDESDQTLQQSMDPLGSSISAQAASRSPYYISSRADSHHHRPPHQHHAATLSSYTIGAYSTTDMTTSRRGSSCMGDDDDDDNDDVNGPHGGGGGGGGGSREIEKRDHNHQNHNHHHRHRHHRQHHRHHTGDDNDGGRVRGGHPHGDHPLQQRDSNQDHHDHRQHQDPLLVRPAIVVQGAGTRFSADQYLQAATTTTTTAATGRTPMSTSAPILRRPSVASSTPSHQQSQLQYQQAQAQAQAQALAAAAASTQREREQSGSSTMVYEGDDLSTMIELELSQRGQQQQQRRQQQQQQQQQHELFQLTASPQQHRQQQQQQEHDDDLNEDSLGYRSNASRSDTTGTFG
ncbi:hypothetical protein DFQ27_000502 [Actinomortierella ambigua]|uniref:G-protein coupled receptors family 3 profile domain-containing protein n=1 Tax=Actinomortierella ambigua TaxID=1343610 RepID=A0A9P6QDT9_9FUNG|nr:hypothetical protein DFQ27_000502 [Actinomortierella ambigua]